MDFLLHVMQVDPFEMLHGGPLKPVSLLLCFCHLFQTIVFLTAKWLLGGGVLVVF